MQQKNVVLDVTEIVKTRFESFDNPIFQHMKCLDPKAWEDDNAYGRDSLESLANHFAVPLSLTKFDRKVAMKRMVNEYGNMFYCTKLKIF